MSSNHGIRNSTGNSFSKDLLNICDAQGPLCIMGSAAQRAYKGRSALPVIHGEQLVKCSHTSMENMQLQRPKST